MAYGFNRYHIHTDRVGKIHLRRRQISTIYDSNRLKKLVEKDWIDFDLPELFATRYADCDYYFDTTICRQFRLHSLHDEFMDKYKKSVVLHCIKVFPVFPIYYESTIEIFKYNETKQKEELLCATPISKYVSSVLSCGDFNFIFDRFNNLSEAEEYLNTCDSDECFEFYLPIVFNGLRYALCDADEEQSRDLKAKLKNYRLQELF